VDGGETAFPEEDPRDITDMNRGYGVAGYTNALYLVGVYSV
jgi:hypothetical protein